MGKQRDDTYTQGGYSRDTSPALSITACIYHSELGLACVKYVIEIWLTHMEHYVLSSLLLKRLVKNQ